MTDHNREILNTIQDHLDSLNKKLRGEIRDTYGGEPVPAGSMADKINHYAAFASLVELALKQGNTHDVRYARAVAKWLIAEAQWRLKQANKTMGTQGETIHRLRCQIAELRRLTSKTERAEMRLWFDSDDRANLECQIDCLLRENERLRARGDKLAARNHQLADQQQQAQWEGIGIV